MGLFIAAAGALTLAALAILLRPLWPARRGLALALGLALVAGAALLYRAVGTPEALDPAMLRAPQTLPEAIAQLQRRLARDPDQPEGWMLLGMAYARQGQLAASRDAYARALALAPEDPDALTEAAQSRALAAPDRRFDAAARTMLEKAVRLHPEHQRARWFLGVALRQAGDAAGAARTWEPLLGALDGETGAALREQIEDARKAAGLPPLPEAPAAASPGGIQVAVRLDPALAARLSAMPRAQVFVIARAPGGGPMPVAVERHPAGALPLQVRLDDADSPMPTRRLSQLPQVELLARLSPSGEAMPQPDDVTSPVVSVTQPAQGPVELVIGAPASP